MNERMKPLHIGGIESPLPIVQGGMGVGISLSGLASAVGRAGGIGIISAAGIGMLEDDFRTDFLRANVRALRREIRAAKAATDSPIGVNIMVALSDSDNLMNVAIEEGADLLFLGAGLPLKAPSKLSVEELRTVRTAFVPIVSSGRAVQVLFRYWAKNYGRVPDAVVVEGPLAGGHLGFTRPQLDDPAFALENLLAGALDAVSVYEKQFDRAIPVIAAGGIYTGADIRRALSLGASGVQMATRFVATDECDAAPAFKEAFVRCTEADLTIIDSPVGLPGRAIRNRFLDDVAAGERRPTRCVWQCLVTCNPAESPYCIAQALTHAKTGDLDDGFAFAGANAHRVDAIVPVAELIDELRSGFASSARTPVGAAAVRETP